MTTTLAAITARKGAAQPRCFATLSAKLAAATTPSNQDHHHRPAGVTPSGATEILTAPAKSSDAPSLGLPVGSRRYITYHHMSNSPSHGTAYPSASRNFSSTAASSGADDSNLCHDRPPVTSFSEDELMIRDLCRQWGDEVLRPVVRDMDEEGRTYPDIIQGGLFECGLMGMVRRRRYVLLRSLT